MNLFICWHLLRYISIQNFYLKQNRYLINISYFWFLLSSMLCVLCCYLHSSLTYRLRSSAKLSANTSHPWMPGYSLQVVRCIPLSLPSWWAQYLLAWSRMWPQKYCETSTSMMETDFLPSWDASTMWKVCRVIISMKSERERDCPHQPLQLRHETCEWTMLDVPVTANF